MRNPCINSTKDGYSKTNKALGMNRHEIKNLVYYKNAEFDALSRRLVCWAERVKERSMRHYCMSERSAHR